MPEDLRTALGKSKVEGQQKSTSPWAPGVWAAAIAAYESGWRRPEPRYPVILTLDGPVTSAETLQQLLELPSVPEVIETTMGSMTTTEPGVADDGSPAEKVRICHVSWDELLKVEEITECDNEDVVWFQGEVRLALRVRSLTKLPKAFTGDDNKAA